MRATTLNETLATRFTWAEIQARRAHIAVRRGSIDDLRAQWQGLCDLVHDIELVFRLAGYDQCLQVPEMKEFEITENQFTKP